MNFNRPTFFAMEAMPYVRRVAEHLGLLIADPQETGVDELDAPRDYSVQELIASWEKHNTRAVRTIYKDPELQAQYRYLPRDRSIPFWTYMMQADKFQEEQGEDVFVPKIMLFVRKGQNRVQTAVVWSNALPQVFPPCDLIVRNEVKDGSELKLADLRTFPFSAFRALANRLAEPCSGPVPGLFVFRPGRQKEITRLFTELSGHSFDEYDALSPGAFVDVQIPDLVIPIVQ